MKEGEGEEEEVDGKSKKREARIKKAPLKMVDKFHQFRTENTDLNVNTSLCRLKSLN